MKVKNSVRSENLCTKFIVLVLLKMSTLHAKGKYSFLLGIRLIARSGRRTRNVRIADKLMFSACTPYSTALNIPSSIIQVLTMILSIVIPLSTVFSDDYAPDFSAQLRRFISVILSSVQTLILTSDWGDVFKAEVNFKYLNGQILLLSKRVRCKDFFGLRKRVWGCLLYTSPSPRDRTRSRMPSSA